VGHPGLTFSAIHSKVLQRKAQRDSRNSALLMTCSLSVVFHGLASHMYACCPAGDGDVRSYIVDSLDSGNDRDAGTLMIAGLFPGFEPSAGLGSLQSTRYDSPLINRR
jgi:hypothetical protein